MVEATGNPLLKVTGLCHAIQGKELLKNIDLVVDHHLPTMILGPNGAGKSLLLRLLHSLIPLQTGQIFWNGQADPEKSRQAQAMVFQRPVLFRRSVEANMRLVMDMSEPDKTNGITYWLKQAGLEDRAGQSARSLSGGEQQKLALVRALATEPDILFLDEATASLDPRATRQIERIVLEAAQKGVKIIGVTHDFGQARRLAHDIVFMTDGQVIEHDLADRFFTGPRSKQARGFLDGTLIDG